MCLRKFSVTASVSLWYDIDLFLCIRFYTVFFQEQLSLVFVVFLVFSVVVYSLSQSYK